MNVSIHTVLNRLLFLFTFIACSVSVDRNLMANEVRQSYSVENDWLKADIRTEEGSYLTGLTSKYVLSDLQPKQSSFIKSHSIQLFQEHPYESDVLIPFPEVKRIRQLKDIEDTIPSIHWLSETDGDISMVRSYAMNASESILHVTTVIKNTSEQEITFFPTEQTVLDVSEDIGKATPDLYLYMPSNSGGSVKTVGGKISEDSGVEFLPNFDVFLTSYKPMYERSSWRISKPWFGLYDKKDRRSLGFEIHADSDYIQSVNHGLIFQRSKVIESGAESKKQSSITLQYVIGKVNLPPRKEIQYVMKYSVSTSLYPIVDVNNGITYVKEFEVFTHPLGFYLIGIMGVPMTGKFGVEYFDEDGNVMRRTNTVYGLNVDRKNVPMLESQYHLPAVFTTLVGGFGEMDSEDSSKLDVHETVKKIQLVLIDPDTEKTIKVLGESVPPWKPFEN